MEEACVKTIPKAATLNLQEVTFRVFFFDFVSVILKNDSFPSKTDLAASSPVDWDKLERPRRHSHEEDGLRRTQSQGMSKRMVNSMEAFLVENQSESIKVAAKSLKDGAAVLTTSRQKKHKSTLNRYIGMVPTAPVRDQPVGSSEEKVNLRFRYKLTNLRRKVINERDGNSKVVRFNESRMAKFGWLAVWQGTVFAKPSAPFIWFQLMSLFSLSMLSFAICYLASKYCYTIVSWSDFDETDLVQVWEVLDEFKVVSDTAQVLTTLVSFLLGLYVTKTVGKFFLPLLLLLSTALLRL